MSNFQGMAGATLYVRAFKQCAWVVRDLETSVLRWAQTVGVGPFIMFDNPQFDDLTYRGKPATIEMRGAIAQAGDMQIELIEQKSNDPSAYRDTVTAESEGLHHMAVHVKDFDAQIARYQDAGNVIAAQGSFGALRFAYVDTSPQLGFMIELIDVDEATSAFYAEVTRLAENWDGSKPLRRSEELVF